MTLNTKLINCIYSKLQNFYFFNQLYLSVIKISTVFLNTDHNLLCGKRYEINLVFSYTCYHSHDFQ